MHATVGLDDAATVTAAVPTFVSLVAVIVAVPALMPETNPVGVTVATVGSELDQVTERPVSVAPLASFVVAVSCAVDPMMSDAVAGDTVTDATAGGDAVVTVNAAEPVFPPAVAVIKVDPAATAVTVPFELTVATPVLLELHATIPVAIGDPF